MESDHGLSTADIGVVIGYFVLVILVGIFAMWRANRSTVSGYFLAGRSMWFLPIGASLFVSNIGTEHFIGLAGSGAAQGISVGAWEFNALMLLQLLGWIFLPVYIACGVCTMPEYLSKRFGGNRLRAYFAFLSLVLYIFTKCSGDLYTGALFIQQSLHWDLYVSIVILIVITALLTLTGGLTAVIYTDTLQAVLMVGGALYLMARGFAEVGGFSGLLERYPQAVPTNVTAIVPNTTCHHPDKMAFRMLRDVDDDYMPWLGFLLGQTPGSIWYWCTDQVIVQRALAARSISHAQGATLMAGFIKVLPLFVMVMPGMVSRVLYPKSFTLGLMSVPIDLHLRLIPGAFWSLMLALLTGVVRLFSVLILKGEEYCGSKDEYPEPPILSDFHYMYFAMFITLMTAAAAILISLATGKPDKKLLFRTTYWTRHQTGHVQTEEMDDIEMSYDVTSDNNVKDGTVDSTNGVWTTGDGHNGTAETGNTELGADQRAGKLVLREPPAGDAEEPGIVT
ncbi:sodium/myo-inositol cotransporter, partial [Aplysia californica]|uniref:Sodium/myo-inositol cotransporter n=1 Tax=Aplysia californica TaxID=6500 RepID=A0ABM1W4C0_APLCA